MKPLEERKQKFHDLVAKHGVGKYSKLHMRTFYDYWTRHNDPIKKNTKMLFEKAKKKNLGIFNIPMRMATWEKLGYYKNQVKTKDRSYPNYYDKQIMQKLQIKEQLEYEQHLKSIGWIKTFVPTGTHWKTPKGKIIWL